MKNINRSKVFALLPRGKFDYKIINQKSVLPEDQGGSKQSFLQLHLGFGHLMYLDRFFVFFFFFFSHRFSLFFPLSSSYLVQLFHWSYLEMISLSCYIFFHISLVDSSCLAHLLHSESDREKQERSRDRERLCRCASKLLRLLDAMLALPIACLY